MDYEKHIVDFLRQDAKRMEMLEVAAILDLPDWCLAAGFVRNLVWDRLHRYPQPTPLNDIDLIYFDSSNIDPTIERTHESRLASLSRHPWSVKNQARMHARNNDAPYTSCCDAMSYWVEVETAIGARLLADGSLKLIAPFGCEALFLNTITLNKKRPKKADFEQRMSVKGWLKLWPKLHIKAFDF